MSSIGDLFQAKENYLVGRGTFFSVDKKTRGDGIGYLRDSGNDIIGFTLNGKHTFLENIQKDSSGTLFKTARHSIPTEDINKIISAFLYYNLKNEDKLRKSDKHLFVQVKDKSLIDKLKNKRKTFGLEDKTVKFKKVDPFVDVQEPKSKIKIKKSKDKDKVHPSVDLKENKSKIKTKKSKDKDQVHEITQEDLEDIDTEKKTNKKTKKRS